MCQKQASLSCKHYQTFDTFFFIQQASQSVWHLFVNQEALTGILVVTALVAGTSILMWLGEQITSKGIGNGISLLIFIGIVSRLPSGIATICKLIVTQNGFSTTGLLTAIGIVVGALILVTGVVFVQQAERRVPVQYSKKVVGRKMEVLYQELEQENQQHNIYHQ